MIIKHPDSNFQFYQPDTRTSSQYIRLLLIISHINQVWAGGVDRLVHQPMSDKYTSWIYLNSRLRQRRLDRS